jgi:hypothetical protein
VVSDELACFLDGEDVATLVGSALTAGAMRELALVAVGALGDAGGGEEVVAAALRGALLGVTPFWIRHCCIPSRCFEILRVSQAGLGADECIAADGPFCRGGLLLDFDCACQPGERVPARVGRSLIAVTGGAVQVLATAWAKSLAVRRAERAAGQGEKHLFAHDILKQKTALSIIPDFCLVDGNCSFPGGSICAFGTEDEVEFALHGNGDGVDAAGAEDFEVAFIAGAEADIADELVGAAVFDEKVGLAVDGQGADLEDVGGVVDQAGSELLVDDKRFFFEIEGSNQHINKGMEIGARGQMRMWQFSGKY